ncbi:hypothetical protein QTP70_002478 [Hemibagrus guttatus]|uniref:ribonuclease H n=1 Tax=Hemibagrus guttatus TaxID=175788 RepID=A0AAE0QJX2_9TELE|nr:hypothetical protein QTP70_002478 [Hemibagrus guttatus]
MSQKWFDEHSNKFEMLTWPPNSPDLNPIECLWDVLDKQVRSLEPPFHNLQDLKDLLLTSWCQIPQHTYRNLVESMLRWVRAVLAAKGVPTGTPLLCGVQTRTTVVLHLEKAYDRVPREELWYCMRKSGVAEKYVRVVQDMYERSRTVVRCAVGQTEEFNVEVGLHQGSALSPFLFAIVMDQLSEEVRQESPWTMMFADDIVICSESREQVEENLERWRFALERRGMKVSRSKIEYMCVNEREGSGTVRLQGEEVKKVQEFKYLGSTVQSNGECGKEVKKRVQAETVSLRKRQESELEVAEMKMLREARLRWFGHVQRRESEYIGRRMLDMELPGRRQRGRPKRRVNDLKGIASGSFVESGSPS